MDSKGSTQVKSPEEKRKSYLQRISEITSPELAEAVDRARADYSQKLAEEIQTSTTQKEKSINDFERSTFENGKMGKQTQKLFKIWILCRFLFICFENFFLP